MTLKKTHIKVIYFSVTQGQVRVSEECLGHLAYFTAIKLCLDMVFKRNNNWIGPDKGGSVNNTERNCVTIYVILNGISVPYVNT